MADVSGVLTKKAQPAWKLIGLIIAIALATLKLIDIDHKLATAAAQEVLKEDDQLLKAHISETSASRRIMEDFVVEDRQFKKDLRLKVEALCRANPRANCPL